MSDQVTVQSLPQCDMCGDGSAAEFDGATAFGPWANMCNRHFGQFGVGLGTGRGQRLVLATNREGV